MKTSNVVLFLTLMALASLQGCGKAVNKVLWGSDQNPVESNPSASGGQASLLRTVACCQDNTGGVLTYPPFVPASHVAFCQLVREANRKDERINGLVYLARDVDCGHGHQDVGDNYYPPNGY